MSTGPAPVRIERDALGELEIPGDVPWGVQTKRALLTYDVSGLQFPRSMIRALGLVKKAAAQVNMDLGLLSADLGMPIVQVSQAIAEGRYDDYFVVDIFQSGVGTATHMNLNEVIAGLANELITGTRGGASPVHPNNAVNICQTSNDLFPTALTLAAYEGIQKRLLPALEQLQERLAERAKEFDSVVKVSRPQLQDAVPIRLGQEFSAYARQIEHARRRVKLSLESLQELPMGGSAVGTGLNTHPEFGPRVAAVLSQETGLPFRPAANLFEALSSRDETVELSGALKTTAIALSTIANNIRWMASGPRAGFGEIKLPEVQPGGSAMPGKVVPVIPEIILQVAAQVIGNDATVSWANGQGSSFELNTMTPVIAYNLLQSIDLLANGARLFDQRCVTGLKADEDRCREHLERSLSISPVLASRVGYDGVAAVVRKAHGTGASVRAVLTELVGKTPEEVATLLGPPYGSGTVAVAGEPLKSEEIDGLLDPRPQTHRPTATPAAS